MFCAKCGNQFSDGAKFCPKCGNPVSKTTSPAGNFNQVEQPLPPQQAGSIQQSIQPQVQQGSDTAGNAYSTQFNAGAYVPPVKEKKSHKGLFIGIGVGVVAIATAAVGLCVFGPFKAFFENNNDLMADALIGASDDFFTNYGSYYDDYANAMNGTGEYSGSYEATITLEDSAKILLESALASELGTSDVDLSWIDSSKITATYDIDEDGLGFNTVFNLNDQDIASMDFLADNNAQYAYLCIPEISDKYIGGSYDSLDMDVSDFFEAYASSGDDMATSEELKESASKYIGIIVEDLDEIEKTKETLEVDGVSAQYTLLSTDITVYTDAVITKDLCTAFKDDADMKSLLQIIVSVYETDELPLTIGDLTYNAGDDFDEFYNSLVDSCDDIISECDDIISEYEDDPDSAPICGDIQVYVDSDGSLAGYEFSERDADGNDYSIYFYEPRDGESVGLQFGETIGSSVEFEILGSGEEVSNTLSGIYTITNDGTQVATVEVVSLNTSELKDGTIDGEFIITLDNVEADDSNLSQLLLDTVSFDVTANLTSTSKTYSIAVMAGDNKYATIDITQTEATSGTKATPSSDQVIDVDSSDFSTEYMLSMNLDTLIDRLKSANVPSDYTDLIELYYGYIQMYAEYSSYSSYDYYSDYYDYYSDDE